MAFGHVISLATFGDRVILEIRLFFSAFLSGWIWGWLVCSSCKCTNFCHWFPAIRHRDAMSLILDYTGESMEDLSFPALWYCFYLSTWMREFKIWMSDSKISGSSWKFIYFQLQAINLGESIWTWKSLPQSYFLENFSFVTHIQMYDN